MCSPPSPLYGTHPKRSEDMVFHYDPSLDMYFSSDMSTRLSKIHVTRNDDEYGRLGYEYNVECWVGSRHINHKHDQSSSFIDTFDSRDKVDESRWTTEELYFQSIGLDDITDFCDYACMGIYKTKRLLDIAQTQTCRYRPNSTFSIYHVVEDILKQPFSDENAQRLRHILEDQAMSDDYYKKYMATIASNGDFVRTSTQYMEIFLLYGGDINCVYQNKNLLQWCFKPSFESHLDRSMVEFLISFGFDINILDQSSQNILHWIIRYQYDISKIVRYHDEIDFVKSIVDLLIHSGLNINHKDICGLTPLDYSSFTKGNPFTQVLLEANALHSIDIDLADKICTRTTGCQISPQCYYRSRFKHYQ